MLPLLPFSGKISISLVLLYPKSLPDFPYEVIWDYHFICEEFFFLKKGYNFLDRKGLFIFSLIPMSILVNYDFSKICLVHLNYKIYYQKLIIIPLILNVISSSSFLILGIFSFFFFFISINFFNQFFTL